MSANANQPMDWDSVMGQFGWAVVDKFNVPYLTRLGVQYTAIRIAEQKLLAQFKPLCNSEIYSCFFIKQYNVTDAEVRLLNEINTFHCNGLYGNYAFTTADKLLKVDDLKHLYNLFEFMNQALREEVDVDKAPCGFIKMDDQPPVPYVVYKGQKYSPMFYFEGASEYLEDHAVDVTEWHLSYLKFCCKIQGIRQEFYADQKCKVVEFEDIKKFLPPETKFKFTWPTTVVKNFFDRLGLEGAAKASKDAKRKRACAVGQAPPKNDYINAYNGYLGQQPPSVFNTPMSFLAQQQR